MADYIKRGDIPLKGYRKAAQLFADDIVAAAGTNWMTNIAEAQNAMIFRMINKIEEAPAADVVEVVKCPKCKHTSKEEYFDIFERCYCKKWKAEVRKDDFCSYGERRAE